MNDWSYLASRERERDREREGGEREKRERGREREKGLTNGLSFLTWWTGSGIC